MRNLKTKNLYPQDERRNLEMMSKLTYLQQREKANIAGMWIVMHLHGFDPDTALCSDCADFKFCEKNKNPEYCAWNTEMIVETNMKPFF